MTPCQFACTDIAAAATGSKAGFQSHQRHRKCSVKSDKQGLLIMAKEITQQEGIPVPRLQPVTPQCLVDLAEKTGAFSPKLYRILKKHPLMILERELFAFQIVPL